MSEDDGKTVFQPSGATSPPAGPNTAPPAAEATIAIPASRHSHLPEPSQRRASVGVQVGDVLNNTFELTRFIDRGGMGEVFEGCNVRRRKERVAIKVILPALAADPKIREIFENEADTLAKFGHEALVRYRFFDEDPAFDIFYLVTDFIDGVNLSEVLDKLQPSPSDLINLTIRLASGLRAAHKEGVVHRDMSPDNVILEGGKLERARIIDFGIAKNTDPGSKTIIGADGFAGKLGYVAPEQLGEFSREVGTWTDVYSLGLVILAVAEGRASSLGGNFLDAMRKRHAGVDTSAAPTDLRPVLDRMLVADPVQRLQTMDDVLQALRSVGPVPSPILSPAPAAKMAKAALAERSSSFFAKPLPRSTLVWGGSAAAVLLAGVLAAIAFSGNDPALVTPSSAPPTASQSAPVTMAAIGQVARAAIAKAPCAWLNITDLSGRPEALQLRVSGVAGSPAKTESRIGQAIQSTGATIATSSFDGVTQIDSAFCPVMDSMAPFRTQGAERLQLSRPKYEISKLVDGQYQGELGATAILDISLAGLDGDFELSVIENGTLQVLAPTRAAFMELKENGRANLIGKDLYRLNLEGQQAAGWSGFLLITSSRPAGAFPEQYTQPDWPARFEAAARANGWQTEIAWFKFVDDEPN